MDLYKTLTKFTILLDIIKIPPALKTKFNLIFLS